MTISVQTILSSHVPAEGGRSRTLTTFLVTYPLWIHAQMKAHRKIRVDDTGECMLNSEYHLTPGVMDQDNISRNASSNRAVPTTRLMAEVSVNPAMPSFFGAEQRGMQAFELCNNLITIDGEQYTAEEAWQEASRSAIKFASAFATAGYHKQVVNRLMMPFQHITVVMSSDDWSGFLAQRDHEDADPTMKELARLIRIELEKPAMQILEPGEMHLPFVEDSDWEEIIGSLGLAVTPERIKAYRRNTKNILSEYANNYCDYGVTNIANRPLSLSWSSLAIFGEMIKLSVARCASASYNTVDGFKMDTGRSSALFSRLAKADPMHLSPFEHQAVALPAYDTKLNGNLTDVFIQFRKLIEIIPALREI